MIRYIMCIADVHLRGRELSWPPSPKNPDITIRTQDRLDRLAHLCGLANEKGMTDIVFLGDLFESPTVPEAVVLQLVRVLNSVLKGPSVKKITYILGQHDRGVRKIPLAVEEAAWNGLVKFEIVRRPVIRHLASDIGADTSGGYQVLFVPAPSDGNVDKVVMFLETAVPQDQRKNTIVLGHFPVQGERRSEYVVTDHHGGLATAGDTSPDGVLPSLLEEFVHVSLGDFHHPSKFYVGSLVRNRFSESGILPRARMLKVFTDRIELEHTATLYDRPLVSFLLTEKETRIVSAVPTDEFGSVGMVFPSVSFENVATSLPMLDHCGVKLNFSGSRSWLSAICVDRLVTEVRETCKPAMVHLGKIDVTDDVLPENVKTASEVAVSDPVAHWRGYCDSVSETEALKAAGVQQLEKARDLEKAREAE